MISKEIHKLKRILKTPYYFLERIIVKRIICELQQR